MIKMMFTIWFQMRLNDDGHSSKPSGNGVGWNITLYTKSIVNLIMWEDLKYNHLSLIRILYYKSDYNSVIILYIFVYEHLE